MCAAGLGSRLPKVILVFWALESVVLTARPPDTSIYPYLLGYNREIAALLERTKAPKRAIKTPTFPSPMHKSRADSRHHSRIPGYVEVPIERMVSAGVICSPHS